MEEAFRGITNLYGQKSYEKIKSSHFLIIGIGGVGSWICESLVRSGAINLTIVDLDDICISNINRQVHSVSNNIGKFKVDEMKKRLSLINPQVNITCIHDFFSESSVEDILNFNYSFVFDAIDSIKSKSLLIDTCQKKEIPIISIGASGGKTDPTQIEIADLNRTKNDQLLFQVRKNLRKNFGYYRLHNKLYNIAAVYSKETAMKPSIVSISRVNNCQNGLGSASFVTASFAMAAVSYVVNQISQE